jgi:hypothetical protein
VDGGTLFAPKGVLSLSTVVEASPSTACVLRPVLRLPDMHWDREERARPETAAHFSGEPEALSGEFFLFFFSPLFFLDSGIWCCGI